jgi:hypothetical protein
MSIITKTSANSLFPFDSGNKYYEEDASSNKEALLNAESKLSAAATCISTGVIGARILKQIDRLPISKAGLNIISTVGLITSASLLIGGYSITRLKLADLERGPPVNESTSLTKEQIVEFISRAKAVQTIKLLSEESIAHLTNLVALLEEADPKAEWVYFLPEERVKIVEAARELEGIEKRAKTKEEIQRFRMKLTPKEIKPFSVQEFDIGPGAIIRWNQPLKGDVVINHLAYELESQIAQLEAEDEKADIGPFAYSQLEKLCIRLLPKVSIGEIQQIGEKVGGLRRSTSKMNLSKLNLMVSENE